jgi:hypothetical protein
MPCDVWDAGVQQSPTETCDPEFVEYAANGCKRASENIRRVPEYIHDTSHFAVHKNQGARSEWSQLESG